METIIIRDPSRDNKDKLNSILDSLVTTAWKYGSMEVCEEERQRTNVRQFLSYQFRMDFLFQVSFATVESTF